MLSGWSEFVLAFCAFFLSHSIPVRPPIKFQLVKVMGQKGFFLSYSTLSLLILWWLIAAAGRAPYVELWPRHLWQNWIPLVALLPVCILLAFSVARPNPFSFGGGKDELFDPSHPGIVRLIRHPLLIALALWSIAHLFPNGDLAHVILFGVFAVFAMIGTRLVDRRKQRLLGMQVWSEKWHQTRTSRAGLLSEPDTLPRLACGLALYAVLIFAHPAVIGGSAWP